MPGATFEDNIGSSNTTSLGVDLENDGTVSVLSGTLTVSGDGSDTGSINVASGANIGFEGSSTFMFNSGGSLSGAGSVEFGGSDSDQVLNEFQLQRHWHCNHRHRHRRFQHGQ